MNMGIKRTALRLRFEPMEERKLLSGLLVALQAHVPHPAVVQVAENVASQTPTSPAAIKAAATPTPSTSQSGVYSGNGSINTLDGSTSGPNALANFPPTALLGNGTPTRAELAREKFVAHFSGPMHVKQARFSDQSKIIYLNGLGGSSTKFFLHGDYALAMVFPSGFDPKNPGGTYNAQTNPNGVHPVIGFAFLDDKNNNSGGTVGLDLLADPTSFDSQGRPTRFTFTSDPNVYSGIFYVSQSSGVVTIKYGANTASATFNGRLYTSGLTSPFQSIGLYAQHSG